MSYNHLWNITRLDTRVNYANTENVVYQVHFSCSTTKEGSEKQVIQHDAFTLDYANNTTYVPYSQLTEPQVLQWVFDILTPEGVIAVQTSGEQQLEEFINPTTATPSLPWTQSGE